MPAAGAWCTLRFTQSSAGQIRPELSLVGPAAVPVGPAEQARSGETHAAYERAALRAATGTAAGPIRIQRRPHCLASDQSPPAARATMY